VLQAITAFNYRYREVKDSVELLRERIRTGSTRELEAEAVELLIDMQIDLFRQQFGCRILPEQVLEWFEREKSDDIEGRALSKYEIEKYFFANFAGGFAEWAKFSLHHLIALDFSGERSLPDVRWFLPEASLYEDFCLAVNFAIDTKGADQNKDVVMGKSNSMYLRTGVLTAYYFVEAYLNGIGHDFLVTRGSALPQDQQDLLLEWNSKKGRKQWLKFEDKINEYQKIVLSVQHAPVATTNSTNLAVLLGEGKEFRDAIVHHSPKVDPRTQLAEKVTWLVSLRLPHLLRIADAAIGIVRELNSEFGIAGMDLSWLIDRGNDGKFPITVFH